jgi:hypothetical protein
LSNERKSDRKNSSSSSSKSHPCFPMNDFFEVLKLGTTFSGHMKVHYHICYPVSSGKREFDYIRDCRNTLKQQSWAL